MLARTLPLGPFQANCHIIACPKTGELAIIDGGEESKTILSGIDGLARETKVPLRAKYLLHTHAHLDHIAAAGELKKALPGATIALHPADEPLWQGLGEQARFFGLNYAAPPAVDTLLLDGQELALGSLKIRVIHTPGHSPGGVCFLVEEAGQKAVVYTGDTLFHGSIGRTDLWGGNTDQLLTSIRERLLTLDPLTIVRSGHGPDTTIGEEKEENPFL